jgi:2-iminobutanoate/2-iminopropanoate deaminase
MKKTISSIRAPVAIGPYSQAIEVNGFLYISGQLPLNPETGELAASIEEQVETSLRNIDGILEEAGYSREDVIKTTIFLKSMEDFGKVNAVYGRFFEGCAFPARSTVEVSRLPKDAGVEIEVVAYRSA